MGQRARHRHIGMADGFDFLDPEQVAAVIGAAEHRVEHLDRAARAQLFRNAGEADDIGEDDRNLGKIVGHRFLAGQSRGDRRGQHCLEQVVGLFALDPQLMARLEQAPRIVVDCPVHIEQQGGQSGAGVDRIGDRRGFQPAKVQHPQEEPDRGQCQHQERQHRRGEGEAAERHRQLQAVSQLRVELPAAGPALGHLVDAGTIAGRRSRRRRG